MKNKDKEVAGMEIMADEFAKLHAEHLQKLNENRKMVAAELSNAETVVKGWKQMLAKVDAQIAFAERMKLSDGLQVTPYAPGKRRSSADKEVAMTSLYALLNASPVVAFLLASWTTLQQDSKFAKWSSI